MKPSLLAGNWLLIGAAWLAVTCDSPARAQGAMDHVDLTSARMSTAELTRTDVEALIAAAKPGNGIDLAERSLNGLDLSGLDLSKADLTRARLNRTKLIGARLDGAKLDMAWGIEADLTSASLKEATMFQAQLPRAKLDRADLSGARLVGSFEGGSLQGARLVGVNGAPDMRNQSMGMTRTSFRSARMQG
ncbi:MAG: pentapeptide repeat-containing protein, partial [Geminicoccaceae bacterium]